MKVSGGAPSLRRLALVGCLTGLWMFLAAGSARAQFHTAYGPFDESFMLLSAAPTTKEPGSIASGLREEGAFVRGTLLKIEPTGKLAWAKAYNVGLISAVRETAAGTYTWVGAGSIGSGRTGPIVAEVDAAGAVLWAREIHIDHASGIPASQVYGRFLEIDPRDGGYWVGGEFWRSFFDDSEPWLGKLDRAGNLLWAQVVSFPENVRFTSLLPALRGGVIGVGISIEESTGEPQASMLAVKLRADGSLAWAYRYRVRSADPQNIWQWFADLDRDPLSDKPEAAVVGTVADFCKAAPPDPCDPGLAAAFVGTLNETTGDLSSAYGLFTFFGKPITFGESIVRDLRNRVDVIGGEIMDPETSGSKEGFIARARGTGVLGAMVYGDGAGPFDGTLTSLTRDRRRRRPDDGYLFLLDERDESLPQVVSRHNVVRTNLTGSSLACECSTSVTTSPAAVEKIPIEPTLRSGRPGKGRVTVHPIRVRERPCRALACEVGVEVLPEPEAFGAGTPKALTILRRIPGVPEGRWSLPLVVLTP